MAEVVISDAVGSEDMTAAAELLLEYAAVRGVGADDDVRAEARMLPRPYDPPRGALLLARDTATGEVVGLIGLRPLPGPGDCELRRAFVRGSARGQNVGFQLGEAAIARARRAGYHRALLLTYERMAFVGRIGRALGFRPVPPYYANPAPGTVFMALDLDDPGPTGQR